MYNIPCQTSCLAIVALCNRKATGSSLSSRSAETGRHRVMAPVTRITERPYTRVPTSPLGGHRAQPSVWPWRPVHAPRYLGDGLLSRQRRDAAEEIVTEPPAHLGDEQLDFERRRTLRRSGSWMPIDDSDCAFLPAGGCDDWSHSLSQLRRLYEHDFEQGVKRESILHELPWRTDCGFAARIEIALTQCQSDAGIALDAPTIIDVSITISEKYQL